MDYADVVPDLKSVTLGHIIYVIPFVVIIVVARLRTLDPEIELAARDLGAGGLETIRRITLPIMLPAMIGAGAIAFAFSFDELLITTFTSGLEPTLPMYVVSRLRRTIDPSVNAVAFVMLFIPWVALGIAYLVMRRSLGAIRRGAATVDAGAEVS
jgi:spermidine/putrescine transport system permease protein